MSFKLAAFADEAQGSLEGQIKALKRNGIECLEIRGVDGENVSDITPKKAEEIRKRLDENNIRVWSIGSPYGKIGITEDFESHLDKFKRGLETAQILGAKNIRLFSFYIPVGEYDKYREEVMKRLYCFVRSAKGSNITLCHENEKGIYGDTGERCLEIHRSIPELRAVFDPANFIQCGEDAIRAWQMISPYVKYMHIKDAKPDGFVVPAGKGAGNIPYLLSRYKNPVLTIEPHLSVFEGFDKLEGENKSIPMYHYPSSDIAFDTAVNSLKELLKENEKWIG